MTTIAFLGLGHMGAPMAARLRDAGHHVVGFDVVPVVGVPGYDYRTFNGTSLAALYTATPPPHYLVTTKSNTYSAFVSDVLNLTDKLSVLAALRLDHR